MPHEQLSLYGYLCHLCIAPARHIECGYGGSLSQRLLICSAEFLPSRVSFSFDATARMISRFLGCSEVSGILSSMITGGGREDHLAASKPSAPAQPISECYSALK